MTYIVTKQQWGHPLVAVVPPDDRRWELVGPAVPTYNSNENPSVFLYFTWRLIELDLKGHPGPIGPKR